MPATSQLEVNSPPSPTARTVGTYLDHLSPSKRTSPDFSLPATSGEDRSNAVQQPSVRVPCRLHLFTSGWRRSAVSDAAMPPGLTEHAVIEFSQLSSLDRIAAVAEALEHKGVRAFVV